MKKHITRKVMRKNNPVELENEPHSEKEENGKVSEEILHHVGNNERELAWSNAKKVLKRIEVARKQNNAVHFAEN